MSYVPISRFPFQYFKLDGTPANGYYLKFYQANSSTPINMQTDSGGATSIAKCKLNDYGFPISNPNDNNTVFIPHLLSTYTAFRFVLYASSADADANNVTSGLPNVQSVGSVDIDDLRDDLAASSGSSLVNFIQAGANAVSQSVQQKLRDWVTPMDFGAIGDGSDETLVLGYAIATGKTLYIPKGYTFGVTGDVTGFSDGQFIFGGGKIKKVGSSIKPLILLPDSSDRVWFHGIEFDGTSSLFLAGNAVPAILGYITKSLNVTGCYFHDVIDAGIKMRDGAKILADGNTFYNIGENGIELHNYTTDVRTGVNYVASRPVIEGRHTIVNNVFEKITRYENPAGPLVDCCGVAFFGAAGYKQQNVRIANNDFIDCLRCIWTENNVAGSESDGFVITGNTCKGGVNGGTAENIYTKAGIGIIGAQNGVVSNNTFKNIANHNPVGTETACITISGSAGIATSSNIEISGNSCLDDSGLADRTEWGIYALIGDDIRIHNNRVSGVSNTAGIYLHPTNVISSTCYANIGTESEYSWGNIVPLVFTRENIAAGGNQSAYPVGIIWEEEITLPVSGRIVATSVKLSTPVTAGSITVKTYSGGVEQTNVQIVTADFGGATTASKKVSATSGTQRAAGTRYKVILTTDAGFLPVTCDAVITVLVETSFKL